MALKHGRKPQALSSPGPLETHLRRHTCDLTHSQPPVLRRQRPDISNEIRPPLLVHAAISRTSIVSRFRRGHVRTLARYPADSPASLRTGMKSAALLNPGRRAMWCSRRPWLIRPIPILGLAVAMRSYRLFFASQLWVSHGMFGYSLRRPVVLSLPVEEAVLITGGKGNCLVAREACTGKPRMPLASACSVLFILSIGRSPRTLEIHLLVAWQSSAFRI